MKQHPNELKRYLSLFYNDSPAKMSFLICVAISAPQLLIRTLQIHSLFYPPLHHRHHHTLQLCQLHWYLSFQLRDWATPASSALSF